MRGSPRSMVNVVGAVLVLLPVTMLASCAREASNPGQEDQPSARSDRAPKPSAGSASAFPTNRALEDTIRFYVGKLGDRSFQSTYGHEDEPYTWHIAAERLGQIGAPAVPSLIEVLGTEAYAEMLALYALMLAVQDTAVLSRTGGEPIGYYSVLSESGNAPNRERALNWWAKHRHLWGYEPRVSDSAAVRRKTTPPP